MKILGYVVGVSIVIGLLMMVAIGESNQEDAATEYHTYSGVEQTTYAIGGDRNIVRVYDSELDVFCWKTGANQGGVSCLPRGFVEQYKTTGN